MGQFHGGKVVFAVFSPQQPGLRLAFPQGQQFPAQAVSVAAPVHHLPGHLGGQACQPVAQPSGVALGILAYVSSHIHMAAYLNIMYIPGSEELVIFICAFVGALIGFLWYNAFPAQVFMGDTGSLTIGGIIAVSAIIIRKELLIPILCGVFFVESLSVIIQRFYYKWGKKMGVKQRFFKRTPIHDHFRTSMDIIEEGCSVVFTKPDKLFHESKITVRFWIVTIILAAITIITLKIR